MKHAPVLVVFALLWLSLPGCQEDNSESTEASAEELSDTPTPQDAGDQAWVKRAVPLLWGRRPVSIREVHVLEEMVKQLGRAAMVRAMRVGKKLVIQGVSSRGTKTKDSYSLFGFTAAHNAINKACRVK